VNVLVVSAHPDDEVLGPGGTLRAHVNAGDRVTAFVACCGTNLRYGTEAQRKLKEASSAVAALLGFAEIRHGDLPDQGLDSMSLVRVIDTLERILDEWRPEVLYTHDAADINRDHRILFEALAVAARPYYAPRLRRLACFETPSSTEWGRSAGLPPFDPNLFVDIGSCLEEKIRAFALYESEVRPAPHPRSAESLRARARYWGSLVGLEAAEAFRIVREIGRVR
jgi:LmbE family N-acetylglucosaminyl deacetylase